ncbi:MAG: 4Fe-4S binding protein [Eubacteriales bacterium]|nr:4Fe-4S binding protein [Eubacteriales bacterium]MDD4476413.1 4Fe-4S binding protein [Eubacteriales bacterium]
MAYLIDKELCIGCAACESECPVSCISADDDGKYIINAEECIDCGACSGVCPVDAPNPQ